jgi:DeoR family suf operon transcriptional repressor
MKPVQATPESDRAIVDFLRRKGEATIGDLVELLGVTATAVRQRLTRLMEQGLVERQAEAAGRGRPMHRYSLTEAGAKSGGNSYDQLAQVLWDEVRAIKDPEVRQGLLRRVSGRLAELYRGQVGGDTLEARMGSLAAVMADQNLPFELDRNADLPVLTALACPYPDLAARDRSVCAMEKMLISEVLGESMRLSACRLDGATCCTFESSNVESSAGNIATAPVGA